MRNVTMGKLLKEALVSAPKRMIDQLGKGSDGFEELVIKLTKCRSPT